MEKINWSETVISERIGFICNRHFDGSPKLMAESVGLKRTRLGTVISTPERSPQCDLLQAIATYKPIRINPTWLLIGSGEPYLDDVPAVVSSAEVENAELKNKCLSYSDKIILLSEEKDALIKENNELRRLLEIVGKNGVASMKSA